MFISLRTLNMENLPLNIENTETPTSPNLLLHWKKFREQEMNVKLHGKFFLSEVTAYYNF